MAFTFDLKRHIGVISEHSNGWNKEVNIVSWNDGEDKYDIRDWDETHARMSKGISLNKWQAKNLYEILKGEFEKEKSNA